MIEQLENYVSDKLTGVCELTFTLQFIFNLMHIVARRQLVPTAIVIVLIVLGP